MLFTIITRVNTVRRYNKDAFTSRNSASKYMKQKKKKMTELKKEVDNSGTIIEILIYYRTRQKINKAIDI